MTSLERRLELQEKRRRYREPRIITIEVAAPVTYPNSMDGELAPLSDEDRAARAALLESLKVQQPPDTVIELLRFCAPADYPAINGTKGLPRVVSILGDPASSTKMS